MNIYYLQPISEYIPNFNITYVLISGINQTLSLWTDTWNAHLQQSEYILAHSFQVLFHGWLMLCFLGCGEADQLDRRSWRKPGIRTRREKWCSLQDQVPSDLFLKSCSQFYHLETVCVDFESTDEGGVLRVQCTSFRFHLTLHASGIKPLIPWAFREPTLYAVKMQIREIRVCTKTFMKFPLFLSCMEVLCGLVPRSIVVYQ